MFRAPRAAIWLAAVGLAMAATLALTSTNDPGHRRSTSELAAAHHHQVDGDAAPAQRHQPVRPALVWWVATIAALLLALRPWRRIAEHPSAAPRIASWAGRYDRGPPTGLITP